MGSYEDTSWADLRALTRERRAASKAARLAALPAPVRFSVEVDVSQATARSKSRARIWRRQQWRLGNRRCFYCDVSLRVQGKHTPFNHPHLATVDHRQPLRLGGDDAPWNYAMACNACNNRKADMPEADFRAVLAAERLTRVAA